MTTEKNPDKGTETSAPAPTGHVRLPQNTETQLTTHATPFGTALFLYARSNDSVDAETIGQDYVAFRYDEENLVFAVCDGVGQSFMGDLAARVVGDGLNAWLWSLDDMPADADAFAAAVTEALNGMTDEGKKAVDAYELPPLPPLIVAALEMQREYGSESMFVAGRIALGGDTPWVGLCWLGDSPVAAVDVDGSLVDLGPKGSTAERWNAATGVKGEVHAWVESAERVARVAGYTDGLGVESVPTDADLAAMMERWLNDPPSDDASLFDVRLAPSPQTTGPTDPEDIEDLKELAIMVEKTPSPVRAIKPIEAGEAPTPVKTVTPIEPSKQESPAVEGWRPITGQPASNAPAEDDTLPTRVPQSVGEAAEMLTSLSEKALKMPPPDAQSPEVQKQVQMWHHAALLGLTSAALAMMMMERIMKEESSE